MNSEWKESLIEGVKSLLMVLLLIVIVVSFALIILGFRETPINWQWIKLGYVGVTIAALKLLIQYTWLLQKSYNPLSSDYLKAVEQAKSLGGRRKMRRTRNKLFVETAIFSFGLIYLLWKL